MLKLEWRLFALYETLLSLFFSLLDDFHPLIFLKGKKSLRKTKINLNDKIKHGEKEKKEEPTRKEPSPNLEAPNKGNAISKLHA